MELCKTRDGLFKNVSLALCGWDFCAY